MQKKKKNCPVARFETVRNKNRENTFKNEGPSLKSKFDIEDIIINDKL